MALTKTLCNNCGVENPNKPNYCPNCGEENPWIEEAVYKFDEDDLPIIFECNFHNDNFKLRQEFLSHYFNAQPNKKDIKNFPDDFPRLKYSDASSYYIITEDLNAKGPFKTKEKAEEFISDD